MQKSQAYGKGDQGKEFWQGFGGDSPYTYCTHYLHWFLLIKNREPTVTATLILLREPPCCFSQKLYEWKEDTKVITVM